MHDHITHRIRYAVNRTSTTNMLPIIIHSTRLPMRENSSFRFSEHAFAKAFKRTTRESLVLSCQQSRRTLSRITTATQHLVHTPSHRLSIRRLHSPDCRDCSLESEFCPRYPLTTVALPLEDWQVFKSTLRDFLITAGHISDHLMNISLGNALGSSLACQFDFTPSV
jgi:hypothetical protein